MTNNNSVEHSEVNHYDNNNDNNNIISSNINKMLLYQYIDSSFPTGGFAHSNSIEILYQTYNINNVNQLYNNIEYILQQNITQNIYTIYYIYKHGYNMKEHTIDYDRLKHITLLYNSTIISNTVSYRASYTQGSSLLMSCNTLLNDIQNNILTNIKQYINSNKLPIHYTIIHTLLCCILHMSYNDTIELYIYLLLRQCISSAVRLNIVGPNQGQQIQAKLIHNGVIYKLIQKYSVFVNNNSNNDSDNEYDNDNNTNNNIDDIDGSSIQFVSYSSNPLLDVLQPMHDRLYARMFNS